MIFFGGAVQLGRKSNDQVQKWNRRFSPCCSRLDPNCHRPALGKTAAKNNKKKITPHHTPQKNQNHKSQQFKQRLFGRYHRCPPDTGLQQPSQPAGYCHHLFGDSHHKKRQLLPAQLANKVARAEDLGEKGSKRRAKQLHTLAKTPRRPTARTK